MKCEITEKGLKSCEGLSSVLQSSDSRGTRYQGAFLNTIVNLDTMKFARHLAVLKSGDHGKRGLVMNYCPFCGTQIYDPEPRS